MSYGDISTKLSLVRQPSQYLGSEINRCRKDANRAALRWLLAFPDLYQVGMSYQGLQVLYHVLNGHADISAERVFAPDLDMETLLREENEPLRSLETRTPIGDFAIIGFSLLYELSFTNVLAMLDLGGIPFSAADREDTHPLVIGGGPCTFNPEPIAELFDAVVIGDGEEVVLQLAHAWFAWRQNGDSRTDLLAKWAELPGVYVPSFFRPDWDARGNQVLVPQVDGYSRIRKAVVTDIDAAPLPDRPIVAFGNPIHDRLSLEICRGCTRGCRFCQAGMIYRPVRERHPKRLLSGAMEALSRTGYEELSLLSLSTGDYESLPWLMEQLMNRCEPEKVAVSLPSLRVGSLSRTLMDQIKRVRKTGFTIAPEAGTQRLRDAINKNIDEPALFASVEQAMALGWQGVKLYFMIGLPTETDLDIDAIIDLAGRLSRIRAPKGWKGVTISVSTFVPKAHTPFQWCEQISLEESRQKIARLKTAMRKRRIRFKWQNPEMSLLEGIWARGDRKLTPLLLRAYERNCRFDGWSDRFDLSRWKKAMADVGVDVEACLGARGMNDPLPWDHIDSGVSKQFLQNEWGKALSLSLTPDCRHDDVCHRCGVCDFTTIRPVIHRHVEEDDTQVSAQDVCRFSDYVKRVLFYQKVGPARFFGHLELARIFERAFRRARIPVRYSQGFHPSPKLSFDTALPVGMESKEEGLSVEVPPAFTDRQVTDRLNESLPPGLRITECLPAESAVSTGRAPLEWYVITLRDGRFRTDLLKSFENCGTWIRKKVNRKGRVSRVDLKQLVSRVVLSSPQQCELTLDGSYTPRLRVPHILQEIFNLSETTVKLARIEKQAVRDGI